jgi:hypothetical protein
MVAALLRAIFNADSGEAARALVGDALERVRQRGRVPSPGNHAEAPVGAGASDTEGKAVARRGLGFVLQLQPTSITA